MSAQRIGEAKTRKMAERTGLELERLWRHENRLWEGIYRQGGGHVHVYIDPVTAQTRPTRGGCFGGDDPTAGCYPFGKRYWIATFNPDDFYPAEARRQDFDTVARAIRELGNHWVRGQVPPAEIGDELVGDAMTGLSRLAVAAEVPLETEFDRAGRELRTPTGRRRQIAALRGFTGG